MDDEYLEHLIEEHEKDEKEYLERIIDDILESDELDRLIADRLEYIDNHFDFEPSPVYEQLEEIYLQQYDSMESAYNGDGFQEYIPNDDPFDSLEGYDYPEGPDENIDGIKYPGQYVPVYHEVNEPDYDELYADEPDYEDYYEEEIEEPDFEEPDYAKLYEEIIQEAEIEKYEEDYNLKNLIEQHITDEKEFLDSILIDVIQEQSYFEKAIDELIFEHIEEEYLPQDFDYEPDYWYDDSFENWSDEVWPEDESIKDPFDSLDDIDYPDFEPRNYDFNVPEYHDDEEEKWLELEMLKMEKAETMLEPPEEIILEPPEEEKIIEFVDEDDLRNQELIKNYVDNIKESADNYLSKDNTLDKIIKEKLKEKKFNQ